MDEVKTRFGASAIMTGTELAQFLQDDRKKAKAKCPFIPHWEMAQRI